MDAETIKKSFEIPETYTNPSPSLEDSVLLLLEYFSSPSGIEDVYFDQLWDVFVTVCAESENSELFCQLIGHVLGKIKLGENQQINTKEKLATLDARKIEFIFIFTKRLVHLLDKKRRGKEKC
jgi:hypothetical protein